MLGERADILLLGRIADLALDAEHGIAAADVVARAGAVEDTVVMLAFALHAVPTAQRFDMRAVKGLVGVLRHRGSGEGRGRNGEGCDKIFGHDSTPFAFLPACSPDRRGGAKAPCCIAAD